MPACLVIRVEGDRITRIDEYLDPKPVIGVKLTALVESWPTVSLRGSSPGASRG